MKSYLKTHAFQLSLTAVLALAAVFGVLPAEASSLPMFALMAAPTFDITEQVAQTRKQSSRRVEFTYHIDANTLGDLTGLAASETAGFASLPAGYVHERLDVVLRTAEGAAATVDIGTEADPDCFMDGGSVNGTPDAHVALAGTEAAVPGTYYDVSTPVRLGPPAAAATLDDCIFDVTFVGYMMDTGDEK